MDAMPHDRWSNLDRDHTGRLMRRYLEHDPVDAPHLATVAICHWFIEQISNELHNQPPRISSGTTTSAIAAAAIVSVASRALPIGPLGWSLTKRRSFIRTRNGSTTTGIRMTVKPTASSVRRSGSKPHTAHNAAATRIRVIAAVKRAVSRRCLFAPHGHPNAWANRYPAFSVISTAAPKQPTSSAAANNTTPRRPNTGTKLNAACS